MKNVTLKFDTLGQAETHLLANGWKLTEDGKWYRSDRYHDIRFVHPMRETGKTLTDDEGNEYPEMETIEGVHINVCCPSGCCQSNITVDSPCEVWS